MLVIPGLPQAGALDERPSQIPTLVGSKIPILSGKESLVDKQGRVNAVATILCRYSSASYAPDEEEVGVGPLPDIRSLC